MSIELNAELRTDKGKGASRRLRHTNKVPAILYGTGKDPVSLMLEQKDIQHQLPNESFYSQVLSLNVAGSKEDVLLRDLQHHPFRMDILHIDFQRVDANKAVHVHIPLHFIGEEIAPGVKTEGGAVSHIIVEVEVVCLPKDIPTFIEVDLSALHVGDSIHLSELILPENVKILALTHGDEHDTSVANVHIRKAVVEEEEPGAEEAAEGETPEADGDKAEDGDSES